MRIIIIIIIIIIIKTHTHVILLKGQSTSYTLYRHIKLTRKLLLIKIKMFKRYLFQNCLKIEDLREKTLCIDLGIKLSMRSFFINFSFVKRTFQSHQHGATSKILLASHPLERKLHEQKNLLKS